MLIIDGSCRACALADAFVRRRDRRGQYRTVAQHSPEGERLLSRHGVASEGGRTVVLVEGERAHLRSEAILRVASRLGPGWRLLAAAARVVPRRLRDAAYDLVSRNRQRLFRNG